MAAEQPPAEWEIELELDPEVTRIRKHREAFLVKAGFSDFGAFRLSMCFHVEKERAARLLADSHDEQFVIDQLID